MEAAQLDLPDKIYEKIIAYLEDEKDLFNLSVCGKRFFQLTKATIEKDCSVKIRMKDVTVCMEYRNLLRNYKAFRIIGVKTETEAGLKELLKQYASNIEKIVLEYGEINVEAFLETVSMLTSLNNLYLSSLRIKRIGAYKGPIRIKPDLEVLYIAAMSGTPIEAFQNCTNLKEISCYIGYKDIFEEGGMTLEQLLIKQSALESLAIDEDIRFSDNLGRACRFQLKKLEFAWLDDKFWPSWLTFLETQRNIESLKIEVKCTCDPQEDPDPNVQLEVVLEFLFQQRKLKKFVFEYDSCQYMKIRPAVFKKAKENKNFETVSMSVVDGSMVKLFTTILKNSPNIKTLNFGIGEKFPPKIFKCINENPSSVLTKVIIFGCEKADFKLSSLVLGDRLKTFGYGCTDLKLLEWKKFFENNSKIFHLILCIKKLKNKDTDLVATFSDSLTYLKTLTMIVKSISEPAKEIVNSKLKYLYQFTIQEPIVDPYYANDEENTSGD